MTVGWRTRSTLDDGCMDVPPWPYGLLTRLRLCSHGSDSAALRKRAKCGKQRPKAYPRSRKKIPSKVIVSSSPHRRYPQPPDTPLFPPLSPDFFFRLVITRGRRGQIAFCRRYIPCRIGEPCITVAIFARGLPGAKQGGNDNVQQPLQCVSRVSRVL
jgi:hypothetical protein